VPLIEQLLTVHQHKGIHSPCSNHPSGQSGLSECSGRAENSLVVFGDHGSILLRQAQLIGELHVDCTTSKAFVANHDIDLVCFK
jgi:hypothetical protein